MMRCLVLALLLVAGVLPVRAERTTWLCEQSQLDIFPDQFYTCEAMQNFKRGFDKQALSLFKKAAKFGSKRSQYKIGLMYVGGYGAPVDLVEGAAWLLLANERNVMHSTEQLALVMSELSAEGRVDAKARAQALRAEYGDVVALKRRARWVRKMQRRTTGSHLGQPMATVSIPGGEGRTALQNNRRLVQYESTLRETLTTVQYRDFKVLEPETPAQIETDTDVD